MSVLDKTGLSHTIDKIFSSFAKKNHKHSKSDITDFPSALPASDVSAWAKASSKPKYTASEVGAVNAVLINETDYNKITTPDSNTVYLIK